MQDSKQTTGSAAAQVRLQWGVRIPLRDGVRLNATVYLPREQRAPMPAILTLTPYIGQSYHDIAMYFAARGYPFMTVDVRGRGNSEGVFRPLINEAKDASNVVEWLAAQSFCNGKVAMWGGSYAGYVQWGAASEAPPHLTTIVPVASPYVGVDFPIRNNIGAPYWMQWLTLVWGRTSQDKIFADNVRYWGELFRRWFESGAAFKELDEQLGSPSEIFQEWIAHPHQDEYWDAYNPSAGQYASISMPVLTVTGIYDGDQRGALTHYREHMRNAMSAAREAHYLVIGPWDHAGTRTPSAQFCGLTIGPAGVLDLLKLHLEWYTWTMQRGPRPSFLRNKVAYYVMGAEEWRYAETLEAVTAHSAPLYLHSRVNPDDVFTAGSLTEVPSASGPDSYVYDPRDVSHAELESTVDPESRVDHRMVCAARGRHLVYHSAPFPRDTLISGFFKLAVWLAIDQPDTDLRATVYEVSVDGNAVQLAVDTLRARYREGLRAEQLISSTEPQRYDFERFTFVARRIAKGSRLRLVIGPINSIYSQKNFNSGRTVAEETMKDARVVTVKLFHDRDRPSALHVPYGSSEA